MSIIIAVLYLFLLLCTVHAQGTLTPSGLMLACVFVTSMTSNLDSCCLSVPSTLCLAGEKPQ